MAKSFSQLMIAAGVITTNAAANSNTQVIVGGLFSDVIAKIQEVSLSITGGDIYPETYGAIGDGTTDDSAAFALAIAAGMAQRRPVILRAQAYKANMVIAGTNLTMEARSWGYQPGYTCGLVPATLTSDVIAIGDGTTSTRDIRLKGISIHGGDSGDKGLLINGATDVFIDGLTVRGCETYGVKLTSSETRSTHFIHVANFHLENSTTAGSKGLIVDFGASWTTAVYFNDGAFNSNGGGSHCIELTGSGADLRLSNVWVDAGDGRGVNFASSNTHLHCDKVSIDSASNTDVLVTLPVTTSIDQYISGTVIVDGAISMPGGSTGTFTGRGFARHKTWLNRPQISNRIDFHDSVANAWLRYSDSDQNVRLYRSGENFFIESAAGNATIDTLNPVRFITSTGITVEGGVITVGLVASAATTGNHRVTDTYSMMGAADTGGDKSIIDHQAGATGAAGTLTFGDEDNTVTYVRGGNARLYANSDNGFEANAATSHRIVSDATTGVLELYTSGASNGGQAKIYVRDATPNGVLTPSGADTYICFAGGNLYQYAGGTAWTSLSPAAWGASYSGTTDGGLSLTLSNSSADGAAALKLTAGNTQGNQPVLANLELGTSGSVLGILVKGTGSTTAGAAGTGANHITLWGDTASNTSTVLAVGNGTSYTERFFLKASGTMFSGPSPSVTSASIWAVNLSNNCVTDGQSALSLTAGDTQTVQLALGNFQIGASGNVMGLLIQGTGGTTAGAVGSGLNHLTLWANTAANANKVLSVGNGTSYTERMFIQADGLIDLTGITAGSPNLRITATSDTPVTEWNVVGTANATAAPSGYLEISVGGSARYIPFFA